MYLFGVACWALVWTLVIAAPGPAEARRVALVVGNADYKIGPLHNPVSDATAIAEAFERQLGFDKVILKRNLTFNGFRAALDELSHEAAGADIAVVYFAGHGMEVGGKNFLIPIDATLARASALDLEAIPLETVLAQLEGVRELKLVILDACRNNPFVVRGGKRSQGRGLARIEPEDSTLVVYAAKDGTTADDGVGRPHSPFTQALLKHMPTPDTEVRILLGRVGDEVAAATGRQQQPHVYGTLGGKEYYLQPKAQRPAIPSAKADPVPAPQLSEPERAWALIKDSPSIAVIEAFRQQYGAANALYDQLAVDRIEALKAAAAPKLAAVPSPEPVPQPVPPAPPVQPDLARLLQIELKRVGCDPGAIDGWWGDMGEAALEKFARYSKLAIATAEPTAAALDAVKEQTGRICPLECGSGTVERNGTCVAVPAAKRKAPAAVKATAPAPRRDKPQKQGGPKSGMCWAIDNRSNMLVPCSDPRAGPKAY